MTGAGMKKGKYLSFVLLMTATFIAGAATVFIFQDSIVSAAKPLIGTNDIADGAITTPKLANNAVTSPKIAPGAVMIHHLANDAVGLNNLLQNSVDGSKIIDGSVGLQDVNFMNIMVLQDDEAGHLKGWDPDGLTNDFAINLGHFDAVPIIGPVVTQLPEPTPGDCVPPAVVEGVGGGQVICQGAGVVEGIIETEDEEFIAFLHFPEPPNGGMVLSLHHFFWGPLPPG
ncbi:MAG: hypothetical protein ACRD9Q_06090 [Nitrososphaeraceae archaeon]